MYLYRKRYGDRKDGRHIRSIDPINRLIAYFMPNRTSSSNTIAEEIEISAVERYIRQKRMQGQKSFGMLHVLIATYARVIAQYPGLNRYISNRELYARDSLSVSMVIKKEMTLNAPETAIKLQLTPASTANDVYEMLNDIIAENRQDGDQNNMDQFIRLFNHIPRPFLRFGTALLRFLDAYNHMPMSFQKMSPFHCSLFLTSMGSLGLPSIFHHLYDFGNCPMFLSYGTKRVVPEVQPDGSTVRKMYIDIKINLDERICDGHYMATCLKALVAIFRHPEVLDTPPEEIAEDIE